MQLFDREYPNLPEMHSDYFESEYKDSVCENLKNKEKLVPNIPENYADGTCFLVKKMNLGSIVL